MLAIFQPLSTVGTATVSVVATFSDARFCVAPGVTVLTLLLFGWEVQLCRLSHHHKVSCIGAETHTSVDRFVKS